MMERNEIPIQVPGGPASRQASLLFFVVSSGQGQISGSFIIRSTLALSRNKNRISPLAGNRSNAFETFSPFPGISPGHHSDSGFLFLVPPSISFD
jgi:hypothetical protein